MPKDQGFTRRLRAAIGKQKKKDLAERLGIQPQQLSNYIGGRIPVPSILVRLAEELSVTVDYLLTGRELRLPLVAESLPTYKKTKPRMVPVLSWVQAGALATAVDPYPYLGAADEYVSATVIGEHCIALRVRGDSMLPEFRQGDMIVVDIDQRDPSSGDYIVVKVDDTDEATFKRYMKKRDGVVLQPLNPEFREIPFAPEHRIVGKMVRLIRSY